MENSAGIESNSHKHPKTEELAVQPIEAVPVEESSDDEPEQQAEQLAFPLSRVKKIAQMATNHTIKSDTLRLLTKATEVFLEDFANKAIGVTLSKKKKTVTNNDLLEVADRHSNLLFVRES
jgi:histone H3/H4